eukprot:486724_1
MSAHKTLLLHFKQKYSQKHQLSARPQYLQCMKSTVNIHQMLQQFQIAINNMNKTHHTHCIHHHFAQNSTQQTIIFILWILQVHGLKLNSIWRYHRLCGNCMNHLFLSVDMRRFMSLLNADYHHYISTKLSLKHKTKHIHSFDFISSPFWAFLTYKQLKIITTSLQGKETAINMWNLATFLHFTHKYGSKTNTCYRLFSQSFVPTIKYWSLKDLNHFIINHSKTVFDHFLPMILSQNPSQKGNKCGREMCDLLGAIYVRLVMLYYKHKHIRHVRNGTYYNVKYYDLTQFVKNNLHLSTNDWKLWRDTISCCRSIIWKGDISPIVNEYYQQSTDIKARQRVGGHCFNLKCHKMGIILNLCSNCKQCFYCSRKCQKIHWKFVHRNQCNLLAKIAHKRSV